MPLHLVNLLSSPFSTSLSDHDMGVSQKDDKAVTERR
jgi:hypothetical protein